MSDWSTRIIIGLIFPRVRIVGRGNIGHHAVIKNTTGKLLQQWLIVGYWSNYVRPSARVWLNVSQVGVWQMYFGKECIILSISVQAWRRQEAWQHKLHREWVQHGETGRDAVECCVTGGCQWNWRERFTKLWSDQLCRMLQMPGQQRRGQEARLEVNEMRMLIWMCWVTRRDTILNEHIRGTTRMVQTSKKITEKRLVRRMKAEHIVRRMLDVDILGKRRRGRPNLRWKDTCKRDMTQAGLNEDNATNNCYAVALTYERNRSFPPSLIVCIGYSALSHGRTTSASWFDSGTKTFPGSRPCSTRLHPSWSVTLLTIHGNIDTDVVCSQLYWTFLCWLPCCMRWPCNQWVWQVL